MIDFVAWIETHPTTVNLAELAALLIIAWAGGLFSYLKRFTASPRLEVIETASFIFIEDFSEINGVTNAVRASFIINASLINASNEKVVLDHFMLAFGTNNIVRSYRQRLVRIPFPARPRKRLGNRQKYMGVWFTEFGEDECPLESSTGELEPKEMCCGYLLFSSFTWGGWNPQVKHGMVTVKIKSKLTSGKWLKRNVSLRVISDKTALDEFVPGLSEHIAHETTWNHDLSVGGKN